MTAAIARKDWSIVDFALVVLFLLGLYSGWSLHLSPTIPVPNTLAGVAGLFLIAKHWQRMAPSATTGLMIVIAVYLASVLAAPDFHFLAKRFTGLLQITYSLVICYGMFLAVTAGTRRQIAGIFLAFALLILAGAIAEQHLGLRPYSDSFRAAVYDWRVVYDGDVRDLLFYGRIRPKVFASEPAAVTFSYAFFCFIWLAVSTWRWKMPFYLGVLFPLGLTVMPGPTLLMMLVLLIPYAALAPTPEGNGALAPARLMQLVVFAGIVLGALGLIAATQFSVRLHALMNGQDGSFFYREVGPYLVARSVFINHPWAGAGLTGEPYLQNEVLSVFMKSSDYSPKWRFNDIKDVLTNYFWLHWIYLGPVFGTAAIVAMTNWLARLGVSATLFCWATWIIMGQAAGGYVTPNTWAVMFIAAAAAVLMREPIAVPSRAVAPRAPIQRVPETALGPGMSIAFRQA